MKSISIEQLPPNLRQAAQRYLKRNPGSPAAKLRPLFILRGTTWTALKSCGPGGFGTTPAAALRAFNKNYAATTKASGTQFAPPRK